MLSNTTAIELATDAVNVALVAASLIFHHSLHLSGGDEAVIVSVLAGALTSKVAVKALATGLGTSNVIAPVAAADPSLLAAVKGQAAILEQLITREANKT